MEETIGFLKADEERLRGQVENRGQQQLLLTEEELTKRESKEGQLLLTREEWLRRSRGGTRNQGDAGGRGFVRGGGDMSKIRFFNCSAYGHYAAEC